MTKPDEAIRKVIEEESVRPRLDNQNTFLASATGTPLPVARADLLYLWDDFRGEYLDFAASANPVGHAHPMIVSAVAEHARYYGFTAPQGQHLLRWPVEYAQALSKQFTGLSETPRQVLYCEGEREACRTAIGLATRHSGRNHVAVIGTGHIWLGQTWSYNWDYDPVDAMWEQIGAVLISPVDPQGRVIPTGVARRWILAARNKDVPVVFDESRTGFGRLGTTWAQERSGLIADLTVLGGFVGGGYPLGVVIASPQYFIGSEDVSPQAGHPVACCAGATALNVVSMGVLEYMEDTITILEKGLDELVAQFPGHLESHHGAGLLRGLVFASFDQARRFAVDCRAQGLYVAPPVGQVVVLTPPLITSTNEMTRGVDLMAATLMSWDDGNRPV